MNKFTLTDILATEPCWTRKRLDEEWGDRESITTQEIAALDGVSLNDRIWLLIALLPTDKVKRLFACWCVRQIWHLLADERSQTAVEVAERHAAGEASDEELDDARARAYAAYAAARAAAWAAADAARVTTDVTDAAAARAASENAQLAELVRLWENNDE